MAEYVTCPQCGAVLTTGGCMSCGYPSLRLDAKIGANTKGDSLHTWFPPLWAALREIEELKATYETCHASRMHAEDVVRRLEKDKQLLLVDLDKLIAQNGKLFDEVNDWRESARMAAEEPCGDEVHCACVGVLRQRIGESDEVHHDLREAVREFLATEGQSGTFDDGTLRIAKARLAELVWE